MTIPQYLLYYGIKGVEIIEVKHVTHRLTVNYRGLMRNCNHPLSDDSNISFKSNLSNENNACI